jgi:hypothetical protein
VTIRTALPEVPAGIATLTDRVLPDLFPTTDANAFAQTLTQAVAVEQPPPASTGVVATSLGALGALGTQNFFPPSARWRVAIVLTDGESTAFDDGTVANDLSASPGVRLVLIHVGSADEHVFEDGHADQAYHAQPGSATVLESLATATGGSAYGEGATSAAIRSVRDALGRGPTAVESRTEHTRTLAPYVALVALVPLALLFARFTAGALPARERRRGAGLLHRPAAFRRRLLGTR